MQENPRYDKIDNSKQDNFGLGIFTTPFWDRKSLPCYFVAGDIYHAISGPGIFTTLILSPECLQIYPGFRNVHQDI